MSNSNYTLNGILPFFCLLVCIFQIPLCSQIYAHTDNTTSTHGFNGISVNSNIYSVTNPINLKGDTIRLTPNSKLKFGKKGKLSNGTVIGCNTNIVAPNQEIFENISISGSWVNLKVYTDWFEKPDSKKSCNQMFANIMALCKCEVVTHLYTPSKTYWLTAIDNSAPILLPSNVYWHNSGTFRMLPTNLEKYSIVRVDQTKNITIDGGTYIGDVNSHSGNSGEWGHGILLRGAKNIVLRNLISSYQWGDGIDLLEARNERHEPVYNCTDILIENVKCTNNRRQGLSIESGFNVKVLDSEFINTGYPLFTKPGAGIDIEPWTNNCDKIKDILISNCRFYNNRGKDLLCISNLFRTDSLEYDSHVSIKNCNIAKLELKYTAGCTLTDCKIGNLTTKKASDITLDNCIIYNYNQKGDVDSIKLIKTSLPEASPLSWLIPTLTGGICYTFFLSHYKK